MRDKRIGNVILNHAQVSDFKNIFQLDHLKKWINIKPAPFQPIVNGMNGRNGDFVLQHVEEVNNLEIELKSK